MNFLQTHLLSCILFSPLIGVLALLLIPANHEKAIRWAALSGSLIPLGLTVYAWVLFNQISTISFKLQETAAWFSVIHSSYHLGVDGISLSMVVLTTLLVPLAISDCF
jgi:NADH-quinone oxidoreductase subunit M